MDGRGSRRRRSAVLAAVALLAAVAVSCGPLPGSPKEQPLPPGATVLATSPPGTSLHVEAATGDLSRIVVGRGSSTQYDLMGSTGSYSLIDTASGATTPLPFTRLYGYTTVDVSGDGSTVVFSSPDPALQVGPVSANCFRVVGLFQPLVPMQCAELYRYDVATGQVDQLTGLSGSSTLHQVNPELSFDGSSVQFEVAALLPETGPSAARLDLVSGEVQEVPWEQCCRWERTDTTVVWDPSYMELTVTDVATGAQTVLPTPFPAEYVSSAGVGRFVVLDALSAPHRVIDTVDGTSRTVPGTGAWVDDTGSRYVTAQTNLAPRGDARVLIGPLDP